MFEDRSSSFGAGLPPRPRGRRGQVWVGALVLMGALALPASSLAQATRTWVSGLGDDANPCSRTAPCKTFAGAYSKTAVGGEIDALDSAGYGALTIQHSITVSGRGVNASVLASNSNGFTINAGPNDRVNLIDLNFQGLSDYTFPGLNGIRIIGGVKVHLDHVRIMNFAQNGIDFEDNNGVGNQPRLRVQDSTINNSGGSAILVLAPTAAGERAFITNTHMDDNACGVAVAAACGTTTGNNMPAEATTINSSITDSGLSGGAGNAIQSSGAGTSTVAENIIGGDMIFDNNTGLSRPNGGQIVSFGDNDVFDNSTNGSPSATQTKMARRHAG